MKSSVLLLFLLGFTSIQAQESANSAGGEATGSGGTVSYSIGQIFYMNSSGTNGSVAQGVQQPYRISVVSGIEEAKSIDLILSAYPNPTTDLLNLKIDASTTLSIQSMSYQLYDVSGKLLENKKINNNVTVIEMSNFNSGYYFLKVIDSSGEIKTFKIIKN